MKATPRHIGPKRPRVNGELPSPADYCPDERHETPCLLPCPACKIECQEAQK